MKIIYRSSLIKRGIVSLLLVFGFSVQTIAQQNIKLSDAQIEDIVRRSYQYVAMYNVNNKLAMDPDNPLKTGGWNRLTAMTTLADHTLKVIARPNNDTLYIAAMLDLRNEPIILETPALDSKYVSLMVTGYDHYVTIPMSTRLGDFSKPSRILLYTDRTQGYAGEAIEGVDRIAKMTGDFVSAIYRVMPHANEPDRFNRNIQAMQAVKIIPLSVFRSGVAVKSNNTVDFPAFGQTDFDVFENNLLEVMQFVFNHTTFDSTDELDQKVLAAYKPLGVVPGHKFDSNRVAKIDGAKFRKVAEGIANRKLNDPTFLANFINDIFQPKGKMTLTPLVIQSVIGPIGQPRTEAVYPPITTEDGTPMNAMNDYIIRMPPDAMPPATAFWSATLYDTENGFFLPNDRKKYSVGENSGMKVNADGGIEIYLAAEKPEGVPKENWLPMPRGDYGVDVTMRLYAPDLERFENWVAPKAKKVGRK